MENLLQEVRHAIYETFKVNNDDGENERLRDSLEKHVMLPVDDPGEWAPHSLAVIHNESMMLDGPTLALECWIEVSNKLIPHGYFVEHINEAVSAIYKC